MWLVETAMRKRVAEGTQGWSQRGAAPGLRLAVVTGVLGWGRTAGRPQGDTHCSAPGGRWEAGGLASAGEENTPGTPSIWAWGLGVWAMEMEGGD